MSIPNHIQGGCLCGAIRYEITLTNFIVDYCHCGICRRITGAPVSVFVSVPVVDFRYTQGQPTCFMSSSHGRRDFCDNCGSHLVFWDMHENQYAEVYLGSLDQPNRFKPTSHIWYSRKWDALDLNDDLIRYAESS